MPHFTSASRYRVYTPGSDAVYALVKLCAHITPQYGRCCRYGLDDAPAAACARMCSASHRPLSVPYASVRGSPASRDGSGPLEWSARAVSNVLGGAECEGGSGGGAPSLTLPWKEPGGCTCATLSYATSTGAPYAGVLWAAMEVPAG